MRNVLVPIDGSDAALRAMALAESELRGVPGGRLHLLNVQAPHVAVRHQFAGTEEAEEEQRRRGFDVLAEAREMARGREVEPRVHVRIGRVAEQIVGCANDLECDAIIMGADGLGRAAAPRLGSVTAHVVRLARQPVMVVK